MLYIYFLLFLNNYPYILNNYCENDKNDISIPNLPTYYDPDSKDINTNKIKIYK
jgi:hypothetical protein